MARKEKDGGQGKRRGSAGGGGCPGMGDQCKSGRGGAVHIEFAALA